MASKSTTKTSKEVEELREESKKLDAKLKKLENPKQYYIERLHEYNEVKDAAQSVFGALATFERVTVGEIQKKYLPENLKDP